MGFNVVEWVEEVVVEGLRAQRAMLTSQTRINEWLEGVLLGIEVALLEY